MTEDKCDVIIIGGGPAGATLGYELCRRGLSTVLIEKERLPRSKVCAGGLPVKVKSMIPFDIDPVVEDTVYNLSFSYRLGDPFLRSSDKPLVYTVRRSKFDALLLEEAVKRGVVVRDDEPARSIIRKAESVTATTDRGWYTGKIIVGADGANGPVARLSGLTKRARLDIGLESEIAVPDEVMKRYRRTIHVDWGTTPSGYGWIFPKRAQLSVGVGGPAGVGPALKSYWRGFTESQGLADYAGKLSSHKIPTRPPGEPIVTDRILLVGDSAGLADPFTGEGIYYAIRSAQIAAVYIDRALSRKSMVDQLERYQESIDSEIGSELMAARTLLEAANCARGFLYKTVRDNERLWQAMCQIIRGERKYTDVIEHLRLLRPVWPVLTATGTGIERRLIRKAGRPAMRRA